MANNLKICQDHLIPVHNAPYFIGTVLSSESYRKLSKISKTLTGKDEKYVDDMVENLDNWINSENPNQN